MIRQLSVFVENEPGSMMRVTSVLTESHINIRAISTFDTPEFGIMRLVVDEPECAKESLTAKGFVTRITEAVMLGHASTRMTQHYARVMNSSLKEAMNNVKERLEW